VRGQKFIHFGKKFYLGDKVPDAGKGDSGGALVCPVKGEPDKLLQFGVLSRGSNDCGAAPSIFTSISPYLDWIAHLNDGLVYHYSALKIQTPLIDLDYNERERDALINVCHYYKTAKVDF